MFHFLPVVLAALPVVLVLLFVGASSVAVGASRAATDAAYQYISKCVICETPPGCLRQRPCISSITEDP